MGISIPTWLAFRVRSGCCVLALGIAGQDAAPQATAMSSASSPAVARTVTGRVIETLHGTPVPRALVQMNGRAVLTDALGRFTFPGYSQTQGFASVSKPGYAAPGAASGESMVRITDLDVPIELHLEPDALITGTVIARDRLPLSRVPVQLSRANYDVSGLAGSQIAYTMTDSHGEFRFQQPAGQYRVSVRYVQQLAESGLAVLPVSFPESSPVSGTGYLSTAPGEEKRLELRVAAAVGVPVTLRLAGSNQDSVHGTRILVQPRAGDSFQAQSRPDGTPGEQILMLPPGSYDLHVTSSDGEQTLEGVSQATVLARGQNVATVSLGPQTILPLEISLDSSADAAQATSNPSQLNLVLHRVSGTMTGNEPNISLTKTGDRQYEFRVSPGTYRLASTSSAARLTVQSATYGSTDLLTQDFVIGNGAGGTPIRIVFSNATGTVSGNLTSPADAAGGWIYLLPRKPSLIPFYLERAGTNGLFSFGIPPGPYAMTAVSERLQEDLRDPQTAARLAELGKPIEVTPGANAIVNMVMVATPRGRL